MTGLEIVRDERELGGLREGWNALLDRAQPHTVFLTPEWITTWWKHYGTGRPHVVVCREGGRIVGLLPCYVSGAPRRPGDPPPGRLRLMGTTHVCSDHLDGLLDPGHREAVIEQWSELLSPRHGWRAIDFADLAVDGELWRAWKTSATATFRGLSWTAAESGECPFIALPDSFDEYLSGLSGKLRREIRADRRKLDRRGDVTERHIGAGEELEEAFETFVRLHQLRRQSLGEPGSFADRTYLAFHREVTPKLAARGWLRLAVLSVNGTPVAAQHQFAYQRRLMVYLPGYDPEWRRHSVGLVLLSRCIEDAIDRGDREVDMLRGEEAYKYRWCHGARKLVELHGARAFSAPWLSHAARRSWARAKSRVRDALPESTVAWLRRLARRG